VEVVRLAVPPERFALPRVVVPSLNVTVPIGVPLPGAITLTVAFRVTDWFKTDGFGVAVSAVVVEGTFTVCVTAVDVLARKLVAPP
jgi:hypothetical protein